MPIHIIAGREPHQSIRQLSYGFDERGQTTTKTDPSGATTAYKWDARGRLTGATLPGGAIINYSYDAQVRRASRTANDGNKLVYRNISSSQTMICDETRQVFKLLTF